MSHQCPLYCRVLSIAMGLVRCIIGQTGKVDRDGIDVEGLRFLELLTAQPRSFACEFCAALAEVLREETKVGD